MQKKLLLLLFIAATVFTGCQKDTGTKVDITPGTISLINSQLSGTWLFPVETITIADNSGKALQPNQVFASSAFKFDGYGNVTVMPDENTVQKGTYTLTTQKGFIYLTILTPDGNTTVYKLVLVNNKTLKLNTSQPYLYYNGATPIVANASINTVFTKQDATDVASTFVKVSVSSDSLFDVNFYITRAKDTILLDKHLKVSKFYSYAYVSKPKDHLLIGITGQISSTSVTAYYKGLPVSGQISKQNSQIITTIGWDIP